jgi:hypothetical protein
VRRLSWQLVAATTLTVAALSAAWVPAADGAAPTPGPFASRGTLTASSGQLAGLVYDGVATVSTTTGDQQVIELTSSSASLTDLEIHVPCTAVPQLGEGIAMDAATAQGSTASAPEGLTIYATRVAATTGAGPVSWTPDTPPPAAQLGDVSLTELEVDFAGIEAAGLTLPGLNQATSFCTP